MASSFLKFLDHTQRRTTLGRTPLEEWSARRIDLYLTTHNTHNRQTSMSPVGFEPTISAGEQPQTYALDRAATGTGNSYSIGLNFPFNIPGTFTSLIFGVHIHTWRKTSRLDISRSYKIPCAFLTQYLSKNHWSHRNYVSLWVYTAS